jgi:hypothetical protein
MPAAFVSRYVMQDVGDDLGPGFDVFDVVTPRRALQRQLSVLA